MNNLDICKRIAEIEGIQHQLEQEDTTHCYVYSEELSKEYNPLTDDALCFQLMVKHGVEIIPAWDRVGVNNGKITISNYNDSPSRAICLAIIEAHKEK